MTTEEIPQDIEGQAQGPWKRWFRTDSACFLTVWLVALLWVGWVTRGGQSLPYDAFRDAAWSHNILSGKLWADPSIDGAPWWYAPGGPSLMAAIAAIGGQETTDVHARSALWLNPLIVAALFLLLRRTADTWTALASAPLLMFGSLWWLTHLGAAMPSIQGTIAALMTVLLWTRCVENLLSPINNRRQAAVRGGLTGIVLALTAWWHPVCSVVAAGAIGLDALGLGITRRVSWGRVATGLGSTAISSMILAAPIMIHLLGLPQKNLVPLRYIAPEMTNPDFAIGLTTPGVGVLAIIGLVIVLKNRPRLGWAAGLLGISLFGQAPAYLHWWQELNLPILVPHEFQWHGQLALAALAAIGLGGATRYVAPRLPIAVKPGLRSALIGGGILIGVLAPAAAHLQFGGTYLADLDEIESIRQETVRWIRDSTDIDAVFACPAPEAYLGIAGLTGRKCAALPAGHTNPSVDASQRLDLLDALLTTGDESLFLHAIQRLGVTHVLVKRNSAEAVERLQRFRQWSTLNQVFASDKEHTVIFEISRNPVMP